MRTFGNITLEVTPADSCLNPNVLIAFLNYEYLRLKKDQTIYNTEIFFCFPGCFLILLS